MKEQENIWITADIGEKIRRARAAGGLTQGELAVQVNASQQQIDGYEHGEKAMPVSRLFDIAGALGVTVADLVGDAP